MKKTIMPLMLILVCASVSVLAQNDTAAAPAAQQIPPAELDNLRTETTASDAAPDAEQIPPAELDNLLTETVNAAPSVEGQPAEPADTLVPSAAPVKPKIAVYVTGGKDVGENKALGTYILDALAASGRYTTIERSESFLTEIDNEQAAQRSGAIDDSQISRLGRQSGVSFVCVADITQALRGSQVSARILDVESAEVVTVGVSTSPLKTMDDLRKVSAAVVEAMFRKLYPEEYKAVPVPEKKLKFGIRAAYNNSFVSKMKITIDSVGRGGRMLTKDYYGELGAAGSGFEVGVAALVGITDHFAFNFSPAVIIRKPFVSEIAEISETAISVPALFELRLFGSPLRALCGVQLEIPVNVKTTWNNENAVDNGNNDVKQKRADMDLGVVLGASVHVLRNFAIDVKGSIGLTEYALEFDDKERHSLNQVSVGVSYLY